MSLILPIISGLVHLAPAIAGWIGGDEAEEKAAQVVNMARSITGQGEPERAIEAIRQNPEFALQLQQAVLNAQVAELQEETKHLQTVNATMQAETRLGHRWSGMWRPFWGFASAVAFFCAVLGIIGLTAYAISTKQPDLLTEIPNLIFQLGALFSIPGAILGVASWHRGQKQRLEAGEQKTPLLAGLFARAGK